MAHILIIDSGVGGLSIAQAIAQKIPSAKQSYIADNAFYPYGIKDEQLIVERVLLLTKQALLHHPFDAIVVACNTASTVVLPILREHFDIPIIGVVPAIKTAAEKTENKVIALLATPATVNRSYIADLIEQFASDCHVIKHGSSELVDLAERHLKHDSIDIAEFEQVLAPIFAGSTSCLEQPPDAIVLGCTHFPLVKNQLDEASQAFTQQPIHWIDSAAAIARRVEHCLGNSINNDSDATITHEFFYTQAHTVSAKLKQALHEMGFVSINVMKGDEIGAMS